MDDILSCVREKTGLPIRGVYFSGRWPNEGIPPWRDPRPRCAADWYTLDGKLVHSPDDAGLYEIVPRTRIRRYGAKVYYELQEDMKEVADRLIEEILLVAAEGEGNE